MATAIGGGTCPLPSRATADDFLKPGSIIFSDLHSLSHLRLPELAWAPFLESISGGYFSSAHVSPDGDWMAIRYDGELAGTSTASLILTTSDDQRPKVIPWDFTKWADLLLPSGSWLAESKRLLLVPEHDYSQPPPPDEVVIFNPFTGDEQKIKPSFPYSGLFPNEYWGPIGLSVAYDPSLSRVLYWDNGETLVLWGIQSQRIIEQYTHSTIPTRYAPAWTPDGQIVALVELQLDQQQRLDAEHSFRFVFINQNGEVNRSLPLPGSIGLLPYLKWSADGRYLAFSWAYPNPEKDQPRLLFWDNHEGRFVDFCLTGSTGAWSPDGRQFVFSSPDSQNVGDGQLLLRTTIVDFDQLEVLQLDEPNDIFNPVAWLNAMP